MHSIIHMYNYEQFLLNFMYSNLPIKYMYTLSLVSRVLPLPLSP